MPLRLLWLSLGCCLALTVNASPGSAQSELPALPEAEIDIPVEPAPTDPQAAQTSEAPEESDAIARELNRTVVEILTQGIEQAIKGEDVQISPAVATGIAGAIVTQLEQAAQKTNAPQGISEMAQAVRVAIDGGSEAEIATAVRDAFTALIGNISVENLPDASPAE